MNECDLINLMLYFDSTLKRWLSQNNKQTQSTGSSSASGQKHNFLEYNITEGNLSWTVQRLRDLPCPALMHHEWPALYLLHPIVEGYKEHVRIIGVQMLWSRSQVNHAAAGLLTRSREDIDLHTGQSVQLMTSHHFLFESVCSPWTLTM